MRTVKLTPKLLKKIIEEESSKFGDMEDVEDRAKDAEETDADEYADALEKHIDYVKALKIEESRLEKAYNRRITQLKEARERTLQKISKLS